MEIKLTIPNILIVAFIIGSIEEREAICDYICDVIYDYMCEVVDDGKN